MIRFSIKFYLILITSILLVTNIASANNTTETILTNLEIPWEFRFTPDNKLLITERSGFLNIYPLAGDSIQKEKRVRIPINVENKGEGGLLGLELHPEYASNHWIYIYRTIKKGSTLVNQVVRYSLQENELKDEKIILDEIPGSYIHDGGRIAFGPDNYLYITTGDANLPKLAQETESLAGKILRITDQGENPKDNPFNNAVYSLGHRNPQGITWDYKGNLWATEHGSTGHDELNLIIKGKNYGWPVIKGDEKKAGMENPVLHSGNDTWAPAGIVEWKGKLYFAGLRGQAIFEVDFANNKPNLTKLFYSKFGRIRAIGIGPDGNLYITTSNRDGRAVSISKEDDRFISLVPGPTKR